MFENSVAEPPGSEVKSKFNLKETCGKALIEVRSVWRPIEVSDKYCKMAVVGATPEFLIAKNFSAAATEVRSVETNGSEIANVIVV